MNRTENMTANSRRLPFGPLLNHWRVIDQGNPPIKKVAADFGVTPATWSRWERGNRFPAPKQIQPLADFLGIPPCRFFCAQDWHCPRCVRCSE